MTEYDDKEHIKIGYISVIKIHSGTNLPAGRFGGRTAHAPAILEDGGAQERRRRTSGGQINVVKDFNNLDCDPLKLYISFIAYKDAILYDWHYSPDSFTWSNYHLYADDTQLYTSSPDLTPALLENTSDCLTAVSSIMSSLYLKLNLSKTELLVFSPSTNLPLPDIAISVCGSTITPKQHARCLGVILDSDLSFTPHIRSLARSSYLHLKNISRIRPFLTFDSAKTLTVSLIHSRLDYCNSLLIGLPLTKLSPLQSVLNAAARIIFLTNRYTDASTLCQSLHWLPIHSRIQYKTTTLIHKALHGSAPPYISSLVSVYHPTRALRSADDLSGKLVSPKWKNFKGLRLLWRDKIRLNNAIWRAWYLQYIERRKTPVCGFVTPLDGSEGDDHRKPEAVVLEGNYWKRRIEVVMKEYNKWRIYYKKRLRKLHQDGKLSEGQKVGIVVKKVKNCNIGGLSTALQNAADKPLMPNGAPTWRGGELFAACQRIEDGRGKEDDMLYDLDYFLTDISDTLFTTTQNMPPSYQYPDFVRLYNPFNDLLVPGPI
ncbi:unnamed protein product [Ranitomeya imitator]|uniref:Reverse transcriptase domain-containing protein n=1 Tax=Ranitomeya imitator TaxID=111125 RepID=A0ABN9L242_9NEOB|nr:unnamed protein product [Ranitomeya imitator]